MEDKDLIEKLQGGQFTGGVSGNLEDFAPKKESIFTRSKLIMEKVFSRMVETAAHIKGGRMISDKRYVGASRVSQEEVETCPEKWIIKECIPACKILWSKNIYTFMCSDFVDQNAWIEIALENLSNENLAILEEIKKEFYCYSYHHGCINIQVDGMGSKAMHKLVEMADRFVMQDVPKKEATISLENLLIESGCSKVIKNPKYTSFEEELAKSLEFGWDAVMEEEYIAVLDKDKITKSAEEYILEYGAVMDSDGTIYASRYHYNKHLNYLNSFDSSFDGTGGIKK